MIMGSIVHYVLHSMQLSNGNLEIMSSQYGDIVWDR